jgi:hypothetical protein
MAEATPVAESTPAAESTGAPVEAEDGTE